MHGLDWMLPAEMLPRSFVRIISPTRLIPVLLLPTLMTFVSDGFGRALLIATSVVHTFVICLALWSQLQHDTTQHTNHACLGYIHSSFTSSNFYGSPVLVLHQI